MWRPLASPTIAIHATNAKTRQHHSSTPIAFDLTHNVPKEMTCTALPNRLPVFVGITATTPKFNHGFSDHVLEKKILQLSKQREQLIEAAEDATLCAVCMERPRSAVLLHKDSGCAVACLKCAADMKARCLACPQCQRPPLGFIAARF